MINQDIELTQERLKELLDYNPETGIFIRKVTRSNNAKVGSIAGYKTIYGYIDIKIDSKQYHAHRLAWLFIYGYLPKGDLDHIDRIRDNNRIKNLREATRSQNLINSKARIDNTSGIKGVYYHKPTRKWCAKISVLGKLTHIGYHKNKINAAKARYEAEIEHGYNNVSSKVSDAQLYILKYESKKALIESCQKVIDDIMNS